MAKLKEVSKKGAENAKFLQRPIEIVLTTQKDGKTRKVTRTVEEMIREYVELDHQIEILGTFSTRMALEFYKVSPQHPFFFHAGQGFIDFVKKGVEQLDTKNMLDSVEKHLKAAQEKKEADGIPVQDQAV